MTTKATKQDAAEVVLGCANALAALAAMPFVWAAQIALGAYTLCTLWGWFIVPTFHLAPLSLVAAAGLDLVVSFTFPRRALTAKEEEQSVWVRVFSELAFTLFKCAMFLLIGFTLHAWWPL